MDDRHERVREMAHHLWVEAGSPANRPEGHFMDEAGEIVALEDSQATTLKPNPLKDDADRPYGEPVESPLALENEGEFPSLTDQGDDSAAPSFQHAREADENGPGNGA